MRAPLAALVVVVCGALLVGAAGCASIWGFDDLTLGKGDGGEGGAPFLDSGGGPSGDAACVPDSSAACAGKCGELSTRCGVVQCGGCFAGTCGGGGPNVCGTGACTPQCAGKACGASDGCQGICSSGACPTGETCTGTVCSGGADAGDAGDGGSTSGLILFGGQGVAEGSFFGDTWAFNGTSWSELNVTGPPARGAACMATLGNAVVLFGGYGSNYLDDTWTFDGTTWRQVNVQGPPARTLGNMATLGNQIVLFGGYNGTTLNDTWIFDGASWRQVNVSNPPPARQDPNLGSLDTSQVVLFGGSEEDGTALNDTWTFDGSSWTQVGSGAGSPSGRSLASMAALGVNSNLVVLFGGDDGNNMALNDTWVFGPTNWSQPPGISNSPTGRTLAGMGTLVLDANPYDEVVLFGGDDINANLLGDTWTFDGETWTQNGSSGPPPRDGPSLAYLP